MAEQYRVEASASPNVVRKNKPNAPPSRKPTGDHTAVFSGFAPQVPEDIRHALGWLETADSATAIQKLIGAVMSLCWTVQVLELEIEKLKESP